MGGHRERQIAANEAMFRSVNETVEAAARTAGIAEPVTFLCEWGDETCAEGIPMTIDEYEHVRSEPTHFAVRPGHVAADVELVVERTEHYWIVEKVGEAAEVAEETDPRT
jgi:hypothetical protein